MLQTSIKSFGYAAASKDEPLKPWTFERTEPGAYDVEIAIRYCGVCHSDIHQARDEWHNTVWPCVPGHEIVGNVTRVGEHVSKFAEGDLVGVGCMVNSDQHCDACKAGEEQYCESGFLATYNGPMKPKGDGANTFGGYSTNIVVAENFVLRIPEKLDPAKAAPLLCAGVTTFSPLKHWKIGKGHTVGIVGFGGLGHVATQIAKALGATVTVFTRTEAKRADALRLGASNVVVSTDKAAMKAAAGTFDYLLSTIPEKHDVNPYIALLKRDGILTMVGALEPLEPVDHSKVAFKRLSISGSLIGGIAETQEVLDFCAAHGIEAQTETIALADINEAFDRTVRGEVRYRHVIDMATAKPA
jgi:uncharacterized zinc-type alcohol dehydrogenase-like protein